jgi:hypothetical protein
MATAGCSDSTFFEGGLVENKTEGEEVFPGVWPIPAHPDRKIDPIMRRKILFRRFPFLAFVWAQFFYFYSTGIILLCVCFSFRFTLCSRGAGHVCLHRSAVMTVQV